MMVYQMVEKMLYIGKKEMLKNRVLCTHMMQKHSYTGTDTFKKCARVLNISI